MVGPATGKAGDAKPGPLFGKEAAALRKIAKEEFTTTARKINHRATQIGTEADYDETWGE